MGWQTGLLTAGLLGGLSLGGGEVTITHGLLLAAPLPGKKGWNVVWRAKDGGL